MAVYTSPGMQGRDTTTIICGISNPVIRPDPAAQYYRAAKPRDFQINV